MRVSKNSRRLRCAAGSLILLCAAAVQAQPGQLDPTFGVGGQVQLPLSSVFSVTSPVVVDQNSRIISGVETDDLVDGPTLSVFALLPNGAVDTTFGAQGFRTVLPDAQGQISGVGIDPFNRIIVAGSQGPTCMVERLLADGTPDRTFGNNGIAVFEMPRNITSYFATKLTTDFGGGIVVAGEVFDATGSRAAVVKLDSNGNPAAFGDDGVAIFLPGTSTTQAFATGVATDAAGMPIATVNVLKQDGSIRAALVKFTADGKLDATFGNAGVVEVDALASKKPFTEFANLTIDSADRIVATGFTRSDAGKALFFTTRLLGDGSTDHSFTPAFGETESAAQPSSVAIDGNGRIVVSGMSSDGILVYRLNPDGSADTTFGDAGLRSFDSSSLVEYSTLTPSGDIVVYSAASNNDALFYKLQGN